MLFLMKLLGGGYWKTEKIKEGTIEPHLITE